MSGTKKQKQPRSHLTQIFVDIFAGTIAGINVTLIGHPFDTLKVRLQTQPADKPIYSGVKDCFVKTLQWEGPQGLYKGVTSPLVGQMFFRAFMFFSYQESKNWISNGGKKQLTTFDYLIAGAMGWGMSTLMECPIDLCKTQLQVEILRQKLIPDYKPAFSNFRDLGKKIYRINGITGFYQGFLVHLFRSITSGASHIGAFEYVRHRDAEKRGCEVKDLPIGDLLLAGAIGGIAYWAPWFPVDVVKSTMQADNIRAEKRQYGGISSTISKLYAEGGIKRFYKGYAPCMMRACPANAILLFTSFYISEHL